MLVSERQQYINRQIETVVLPLLEQNEVDIPQGVIDTVVFCADLNVDFVLTRDRSAEIDFDDSGNEDNKSRFIPSGVALKSVCFYGYDKESKNDKIVMVHCQEEKFLDVSSIMSRCSFAQTPAELPLCDLLKKFGDTGQKEAINVFMVENICKDRVMHIIDRGLLLASKNARTNAGCKTWNIEFDPTLLLGMLSFVLVSSITANREGLC